MNIWTCKIGEHSPLERGADGPMRNAVAAEYQKVTGHYPTFIFSGWGGKLIEGERAFVEKREPLHDHIQPTYAALAAECDCAAMGLRQHNPLLAATLNKAAVALRAQVQP